ncbi:MAG: ABC transporter ATP-binding protein [Chloroflexi bacterium]|nr:ABC transporter ATP-binding protein [Chloroflexota bacterium]
MAHLLDVRNLTTRFKIDDCTIHAVDGASYHIDAGEIVSIVGESGCGKSASQLSVLQLIPTPPGKIVGGEVIFDGADLLKFKSDSPQMRGIRGGQIGMIFQEPMTSLNPVLTVGQQIVESLTLHLKMDQAGARARAIELLKLVGIPDAEQRVNHYPHQFSGGMRQRVMIAMALCCNPKLLIADEATTAVDVTTQAQLLELLRKTVQQFDLALLIVTHNLGIVARYAQRIYVMYAGRIVESGTAKEIFGDPRHPYTLGLLKSVPRLDEPKGRPLIPIQGMPPMLTHRITGCAFFPRCARHVDACRQDSIPALEHIGGQHYVACHSSISQKDAPSTSSVDDMPIAAPAPRNEVLLQVRNLKMYFPMTKGVLRRKVADLKAVDDVSFTVKRGETLGLVGESGCGKTTVGRCLLRLYRPIAGEIRFEGRDLAPLSKNQLRAIRHKMQLIFQDPYGSLDPRQSAGDIVGEPLKIHRLVKSKGEYRDRVAELFQMVGLDPHLADRVPHEFSGGQRQRIGIARALATNPSFIVCDEPISALDVSIQAQIINLLNELQARLGLAYLFVGHDLSVVRHISNRVAVMYLGRIVEMTDCESLYSNPLHPYTRALLSAVPIPDPFVEEKRGQVILLKGEVPSLVNPPAGCNFHPRCRLATKECAQIAPALRDAGADHQVACLRVVASPRPEG